MAAGGLLQGCGGPSGDSLIVYSPHGRELLSYFAGEFEAANPGVSVQYLDMGSQEILDRLRSERVNPQADVWWGAPSGMFVRAAEEGLLEPSEPTWEETIPPGARDSEGRWFGNYLTPEVIAYNSDALAPDEAPADWDEVLEPRWRDRVLIRDPLASGTMRAIFAAIMYREYERTGGFEAGYDWLRRLDAQTKEYVLNPDYIIPASGTPVVVDGIAVVAGSSSPDLARRFLEFAGSRQRVLEAAERFFRIPARSDIPSDSLPVWLRGIQPRIQPMPMDAGFIEENVGEWLRHWDREIRGRGRVAEGVE
jgi:iron(III) transport system substrate-binding protein